VLTLYLWLGEFDATIEFVLFLADAAYAGGCAYQSIASCGGGGSNEWTLG
jgi:hypothetical protein